ncbi:putative pentatricopeptide repeat-containing protein At3g25060, mitochondrial [Malania oleifera]|uniref:putative pentatricopeptide repeat-containing protein At3g25060, mitochondrial n=1 Tax=Malania oleifera TaxID=397392 RepID=UPI0025AE4593|nr:putative pentatricopeptide repeat-containing protein At3g25060, mitochondrial [Malania oleifera]
MSEPCWPLSIFGASSRPLEVYFPESYMRLTPWPKRLKPLLLACKDRASVTETHALMILTGIFSRGSFNAGLIASYGRVGDIESAHQVFEVSPQRGVDAWNAIMVAYSRMGSPADVLSLYHRMVVEGGRADSSTFTVALKACASTLDLKMGEEVRCRAVDCGYEYDVFVASSVLNLYAKCGKMDEALAVFDKMPKRDLVCWTTMITGFAQSGRASEAVDIYRRMQKEEMEGDMVVMVGLIQTCTNLGELKAGLSIHGHMIRKGLPMDIVVQTSLVDMYAKNGYLELASLVFKKIRNKNVISWSALISGFAQNGFAGKALELLVGMQCSGFTPDKVSLVSALLACAQVGFLKLGRSIHGYIVRKLDFDQISATAVIDMYAKCGNLSCARALFDMVSYRDSISWNAMISGYGIHGHGEEALSLFRLMIEVDLKPDHSTFASLLSALSHSGLVDEGRYWFNLILRENNIQPTEKHYSCMVDLLARAGQVEEAYELVESMTSEPGIAIWVALLSGCCNHKNLLVGEKVAKKVLELKPDDSGIYALVSNFFATARMWKEVAGVRNVMKKTGLKKVPGYSAVEANGKLQAFLMEDKSHYQFEEVVQTLRNLAHEMRAMGYVSETEFVLQDLEAEVK